MRVCVNLTYYIEAKDIDEALWAAGQAADHLLETFNDDGSIPRIYFKAEGEDEKVCFATGVADAA